MKKRLTAMLMVVALLVSLMPMGVLAVEEPTDVGGGSTSSGTGYDDKDTAYADTQVSANKTATENADGTYTVTLSVEGYTNTSSETKYLPADIVLVVDTSTSMEEAVTYKTCGSKDFHEGRFGRWYCDVCNEDYWPKPNSCNNTVVDKNRLDVAKDAASQFVSGLLDASNDIRIGLYDFSGSNRTDVDLTNKESTLLSAIENLYMPGWGDGTDYGLGLDGAQNILEGSSNERSKFVVFLSDGEPQGGDNGFWEANELKEDGATIFTVGIDTGNSGSAARALKNISSQDEDENAYFYAASSDGSSGAALADILNQISETIQSSIQAGTNAILTDVINTESFELVSDDLPEGLTVEDGKTLTWNIGDITATEKTVSFTIKLKDENTASGPLHTNNDVSLTFDSASTGTKVTFNKGAIGDPTVDVYKVTYTDGVEGEYVFDDQVYYVSDVQEATFDGTPSRNGYTFNGWEEYKSGYEVTYTAQWIRNVQYGTPITVEVYVDGAKKNASEYISIEGLEGTTDFEATENDGVYTINFTYDKYNAADFTITYKGSDTYLLQAITAELIGGESGSNGITDNGNVYSLDNVEGGSTVTVYLYTKYNVVYNVEGREVNVPTDPNVYIIGKQQATTGGLPEANEGAVTVTETFDGDTVKTEIDVAGLPDDTTGWFNEAGSTTDAGSSPSVSEAIESKLNGDDTTITFTAKANTHKVIYKWSGEPADTVYDASGEEVTLALPTDDNSYVKGQHYTVDGTYTSGTVVYTHDQYGNVTGTYTFSGWTDPNNGVMGEADVTVTGEWTYKEVPVDSHTITVEVVNGTATADGLTTDGTITVLNNGNVTINFEANDGYVLDTVTVDDNPAHLTDSVYTFNKVTDDYTIKVVYAKDSNEDDIPDYKQVFVEFEAADDNGTVTAETQVFTFEDSATSGDVTPDLSKVTVTPNDKYLLDYWTKDNGTEAVNPSATLENVQGGTTIVFKAHFAADEDDSDVPDKYEVTVTYEIEGEGCTWSDTSSKNYVAESNTFVYDNIATKVFNKETQQWVAVATTPTLGKDAPIPAGKDAAGSTATGTWYEDDVVAKIDDNTEITKTATYTLKFTENPALSVDKTTDVADGKSVNVGDTINYTVTVENTGNVELTGVVVSDEMLPATGVTVTGIEPDNYTVEKGKVTITTLPVGATVTITYSYTTTEADATNGVTNTVTVTTPDGPEDEDETETNVTDYTVTITPANITAYVGGEEYAGVVDEEGIMIETTQLGLPEPGYYLELSADFAEATGLDDAEADDLSTYLTFTYDDGTDKRTWAITYVGVYSYNSDGTPSHYVYSIEPATVDGVEIPVRLLYKDGDKVVDEDTVLTMSDDTVNATYSMTINPGGLDQDLIKVQYENGGEPITAKVEIGTGMLTVLSIADDKDTTTAIVDDGDDVTGDTVTAVGDVTYYVNESGVEITDKDSVQLLVDSVSNNDAFNDSMAEDAIATVGANLNNANTEMFYLDLVDTSNGNTQVTMGKEDSLKIYWPMPDDADPDGKFYVVHYEGMDRLEAIDEPTNGTVLDAQAVGDYVTFDVSSFSPFVLVYDEKPEDAPDLEVTKTDDVAYNETVERGDVVTYTVTVKNTGNVDLTNVVVTDTLWEAGTVIYVGSERIELTGDSINLKSLPVDETITITYYYTVTRADEREGEIENTVTATAGDGTKGGDTETTPVDDGWTPKPDDDDTVYIPNWLNTTDHYAYIVGYEDGTIRPQNNITRAEVSTIFFRLLTDNARERYWSTTNDFSDVAAESWYNNAISTLSNMGIINGYEDGTFKPNAPITRAEFTAIATRFFDYEAEYDGAFNDVSARAWYADYVQAAVDMGLVDGYPDGGFHPDAYITRAEACTIVNRVLHRVPHEDHLLSESVMNTWPDNPKSAWYYEDMQEATNSHDYDWIRDDGETVEDWTKKLPERDWSALETEWATAYSR